MKKFLFYVITVLFMTGISLQSCSDDDKITDEGTNGEKKEVNTDSSDLADLTIMVYAMTDGDFLDYDTEDAIKSAYENLRKDSLLSKRGGKVNVIVQVKFPAIYRTKKVDPDHIYMATPGTTYRFVMDPADSAWYANNDFSQLPDSCLIGRNDYNMSSQANFEDFLRYAKTNCPAKNYVLAFDGHGGGYRPYDDYSVWDNTGTRTVLYDSDLFFPSIFIDSINNDYKGVLASLKYILNAKTIRRSIENQDMHFKVMDFNLCLCNAMEVLGEMKNCTDYFIASTHTSVTVKHYIDIIAKQMYDNLDDEEELYDALCNYTYWKYAAEVLEENSKIDLYDFYIKGDTTIWDKVASHENVGNFDYCITKTEYVDDIFDVIERFTNVLKANSNDGAIKKAVDECHWYDDEYWPYYDITEFMWLVKEYLTENSEMEGIWNDYYTLLKKAARSYNNSQAWNMKADIYNAETGKEGGPDPAWSVNIVANGAWIDEITVKEAIGKDTIVNKKYIVTYNWDGSVGDYNNNLFKPNYKYRWHSTGEKTYATLKFDEATGWSEWLKINPYRQKLKGGI